MESELEKYGKADVQWHFFCLYVYFTDTWQLLKLSSCLRESFPIACTCKSFQEKHNVSLHEFQNLKFFLFKPLLYTNLPGRAREQELSCSDTFY